MKASVAEKRSIQIIDCQSKCRPFLKWVGGKRQLMPELLSRLPIKFGNYFEPFLGGGALLFNLQPLRAFVSDVNPELVNAYQVVRDDVDGLIKDLRRHVYKPEYFYKLRAADRDKSYRRWSAVRRASRLIFLNRTCFNGLYRVNSKGHFNAPFGRYENPTILDKDNLLACSAALQNVEISLNGFEAIELVVRRGDFVYFDPPYVPLSATSAFTSYSCGGFDLEMQRSLYELCTRLDRRGVRFMLSNSSAKFVTKLYKRFNVDFVGATRAINSKASKRGLIKEVIVTNY